MIPLFVGEVNPISSHPDDALYCNPRNCSGERLQRLILGLHPRTYLALHRTNLCTGTWSMHASRRRAELLCHDDPSRPWDLVVLLGRKVADAFEFDGPFFSTLTVPRWASKPITFYSIPHPSGLSRLWNVPGNVEEARAKLREMCPDVSWGEFDGIERPRAGDCPSCEVYYPPGTCPCAHAPCLHDEGVAHR